MEVASAITERSREMRREFDRTFAKPAFLNGATMVDLLAIGLGANNFAVRLSEIAGLFVDKKVTPVPGPNAALVGIAGFRGAIIPVYDLQSLIGQAAGRTSRWLFVAAAAPVGFSFDAFVGQMRVPADAIKPQQAQAKQGLARDLVQIDGALRPIIELSPVIDTIKN
ncbi:MAG: chemotaxis protein CheW [Pseudolabrys sp.]